MEEWRHDSMQQKINKSILKYIVPFLRVLFAYKVPMFNDMCNNFPLMHIIGKWKGHDEYKIIILLQNEVMTRWEGLIPFNPKEEKLGNAITAPIIHQPFPLLL